MNAVTKAGNLAPYFKASTTVVAAGYKAPPTAVPGSKKVIARPLLTPKTSQFLQSMLPAARLRIQSGIAVTSQARYAHTDIEVPDFSAYRRKAVQDPNVSSRDSYDDRKATTYLIAAGGAVAATYSAKYIVTTLVSVLGASADVLALASVEVNLAEVPEGKSIVFKWRGKPMFLKHRTADEISKAQSVPLSELRDPQHDHQRVQDPKYLVLVGVCTHLGCIPIPNAGDFGGYYCPCHGSHYDVSGRIRKGPAPLNLEVPPYVLRNDGFLVVG